MADVNLGPVGAEVTLPNLRFIGSPPALRTSTNKQIKSVTMSDKSKRWDFGQIKRQWSIVLGYLSKTQLDAMLTLNALNQTLHFQNNNVDATWYYVVITSFTWEPERTDMQFIARYKCRMVLKEA